MITVDEVAEVLKYWLASIQYEEALATRPRAWRSKGIDPDKINLREPSDSRVYFKLGLEEIASLLSSPSAVIDKPMNAEMGEFFETWLGKKYRQRDYEGDEENILVAYPAVHMPRGELTGLLRFSVSMEFRYDDNTVFQVPQRSKQRATTRPPDFVRIKREKSGDSDGSKLPFFVDGRLLSYQLGFNNEEINSLFERLKINEDFKADAFLSTLIKTFDEENTLKANDDSALSLLKHLKRCVDKRLKMYADGSRSFETALVIDSSNARTTWRLQQELKKLLRGSLSRAFLTNDALGSYLKGSQQTIYKKQCLGLWRGNTPTESQYNAATSFLGSGLTPVQGPPGTGKTALILHLAAHCIVERFASLADGLELDTALTVICSTNNRAVDNVIDPLCVGLSTDRLPLALRAGSRQVTSKVLTVQLKRSLAWIKNNKNADEKRNEENLEKAIKEFKEIFDGMQSMLVQQKKADTRQSERIGWQKKLDELGDNVESTPSLDTDALRKAGRAVSKLIKQMDKLSAKTEGKATTGRLKKVKAFYETQIKQLIENTGQLLSKTDYSFTANLPPVDNECDHIDDILEKWEENTEDLIGDLYMITESINEYLEENKNKIKIRKLKEKLKNNPPIKPPNIDAEKLHVLQHQLFELAVTMREAWATVNAQELERTLKDAIFCTDELSSLRMMTRSRPKSWKRLCQLFPVWGTTLLSMGNAFADNSGSLKQVIIDEAGQCHPAYAISALMRSNKALIIGDVNQLTPVTTLTKQDEQRLIKSQKIDLTDPKFKPYRMHDQAITSVQALAEIPFKKNRLQLVDHFRCQKEIINLCDELCNYELKIHTPKKTREDQAPFLNAPISVMQINGEQVRLGGSWQNMAEQKATLDLVIALLNRGIPPSEIAVITPYRGQLFSLRRAMLKQRIPIEITPEMQEFDENKAWSQTGLVIGTVHRFQGGERSIVIFSSVITQPRSLPFLNEQVNLLNVAISRAKEHLIIVGHSPTLKRGDRTRILIENAKPLPALFFRESLDTKL